MKHEDNTVYTTIEFVGVTKTESRKSDKLHIKVSSYFNDKQRGKEDYFLDFGDSVTITQEILLDEEAVKLYLGDLPKIENELGKTQ